MKATELINKPVLSISNGTKVGNVQTVVLDQAELRISRLVLRGKDSEAELPFRSINSIGPDAITIESATMLDSEPHRPADGQEEATRSLAELRRMLVITSEGKLIGEARDLEFDPQDGRLVALRVQRGGLFGIGSAASWVPASELRALGPQFVTITANADAAPLTMKSDQIKGGASGGDRVQERRAA
jgi:sporulation protein YlmC with PRC-barrel domain